MIEIQQVVSTNQSDTAFAKAGTWIFERTRKGMELEDVESCSCDDAVDEHFHVKASVEVGAKAKPAPRRASRAKTTKDKEGQGEQSTENDAGI